MNTAMRTGSPASACHPGGDSAHIVVLGIGNLLWADEGFGVRCIEALLERWRFAPQVTLIDGGTQGLHLLAPVQAATHLLILDAIDYGLAPGTLKVIEGDEVPCFLGAKKMSLHQTGFQEVLKLAQLTGWQPRALVLVGCQPEELEDYGGSLRPCVKLALEDALAHAVAIVRGWGGAPTPRDDALHAERAAPAALALADYEDGRPSAAAACRIGDARFLAPGTAAE